ncbi:hypothetical protein [Thioclava sp. JE_KL1]|uniref:hypothetical protein n=1 Tax=Thioclava sp. JE_KL1 TaxID=2651187 RepID=UPI00128D4DC3|nr:hypothetical protein [Thioclava sp. JE_KL1]MPQ95249.1 hypothetical protein [Thioclava sp. JE_KL1]
MPERGLSQNWLISFGMPKCGTTTLGALLSLGPALAVHNAKEPNDFINEAVGGLPRLSGYHITDATRWLVDFSTQYGMPRHRGEVLDKLAALGLLERTRFILSLRPPEALARSYFEHLTTRSGLTTTANAEEIRARITGATDFVAALDALTARVAAEQIYVVKFQDLIGVETQRETMSALSDWLGLAPIVPKDAIQRNTAGQARRYPGPLEALAGRLRHFDAVRGLPPELRSRISRLLSRRAPATAESFDPRLWTDAALLTQSSALYAALSTGPLPTARPTGVPLTNDPTGKDLCST